MPVAVGRSTHALKAIRAYGAFSINNPTEGVEVHRRHFRGRRGLSGAERFAPGQWLALSTGVSDLDAAVALFDCRVDKELIVGHIAAHQTVVALDLA